MWIRTPSKPLEIDQRVISFPESVTLILMAPMHNNDASEMGIFGCHKGGRIRRSQGVPVGEKKLCCCIISTHIAEGSFPPS